MTIKNILVLAFNPEPMSHFQDPEKGNKESCGGGLIPNEHPYHFSSPTFTPCDTPVTLGYWITPP